MTNNFRKLEYWEKIEENFKNQKQKQHLQQHINKFSENIPSNLIYMIFWTNDKEYMIIILGSSMEYGRI